jgi:hypothetical protein
MIETKFRVVCQPGAHYCNRKGPIAVTEKEAISLAEKDGWYHDVYRHGHWGESCDRWFCPKHAKKFGKK